MAYSKTEPVDVPDSRLAWVVMRCLAGLPWLWLGLLLLLAVAAAADAGHFPTYGQPDPKALGGWSVLYYPVVMLLPVTLYAPLLWFMVDLINRLMSLARPYGHRELAIFLAGWLPAAVLLYSDAGGLVTWLAD